MLGAGSAVIKSLEDETPDPRLQAPLSRLETHVEGLHFVGGVSPRSRHRSIGKSDPAAVSPLFIWPPLARP